MKKNLQAFPTTILRAFLLVVGLLTFSAFVTREFTVPAFNSSSVDNISGTGFRLVVNVNYGPSAVYWVVTQSSTVPTNTQIKAGQDHLGATASDFGTISFTGGQANSDRNSGSDISGLTANTQYYIHYYAEDTGTITDQSAAQTRAVSTDVTAPSFTTANITGNTGTALQVNFTLNDDGIVYYVVTNDATAPTKAQVLAGQNHLGASLPATQTGTINVTSGVPASDLVTGLSASTKYRVHYYAKDESDNETASVETRNEPVRISSSTGTVTTSGFTFTAQYDLDGNTGTAGIYYVVTENSTPPTVTQILSGQSELGAAAITSGDFSFSANTNANEVITGLSEGTLYYVHFLGVSNVGSHSEVHTEDETTAVTPPSVSSARITSNTGTSFTFNATISKNATVFYVVTTSATAPSKAEIEAGEDDNGNTLPAGQSGSFAATANTEASDAVTGLTAGVKYRVHFFARDGSNAESSISLRSEPQRISSSTGTITTSGFTLTAQYDMDGDDPGAGIYYVVTTSSTQPTPAQILAGQDHLGGTPDASGDFSFSASTNANEVISGLDDGTLYYVHFFAINDVGSQSEIRTEDETTADGTPPVISSLSPADGATGVSIGTTTLLLTFNENINNINTAATNDNERIILFEETTTPGIFSSVLTLNRNSNEVNLGADGTDNTAEVNISGYSLKANTNYYVLVGNQVYEDSPGGNDFAGLTTTTSWNFRTSGVTINNASSSICTGSFQPIGDIIISENGLNDFSTSGTLEIELANSSDYIFSTTGITVGETGNDISSISVQSASFTKITIVYTRTGGTTLDVITISGLSVFAAPGAPATIIRRSGGTAGQDGNNGIGASSLVYAQLSVGASPPTAPVLAAAQDLNHCEGEDISTKTITLQTQPGVTFFWYADASLSTPAPTASSISPTVNVVSDLGLSSTVPGTFDFYVVAVTSCQSVSTKIDIVVSPRPVANAGTDLTTLTAICPGSNLILGASPTLVPPAPASSYTYSWTSSDAGFVNPGNVANPSISAPNPGIVGTETLYTYSVQITDNLGCVSSPTALSTKQVFVKSDFAVSLASPPSTFLNSAQNPVNLVASPAGGIFSGPGVAQTGLNTYTFSPQSVYNTGTGGTQNFPVNYTVTNAGCTKTLTPLTTFNVSNFTTTYVALPTQYCRNEFPIGSTANQNPITISDTYAEIGLDYADSYNGSNPSNPVFFNGLIRNFYEGYFGGTSGKSVRRINSTYPVNPAGHPSVTSFPRYEFRTDGIYVNSPNANYAFLGLYVEFVNPIDVFAATGRPLLGAPYSFDDGYSFYEEDADPLTPGDQPGSGLYFYNGQNIQLNPVPSVFFNGLSQNQSICQQNVDGIGTDYLLTGGSGSLSVGNFQVNFEGPAIENWLEGVPSGDAIVNNAPGNVGAATFNSKNAWDQGVNILTAGTTYDWSNSTTYQLNSNVVYNGIIYTSLVNNNTNRIPGDTNNPGFWEPNTMSVRVRIIYDPNTDGSQNQPCYGILERTIHLRNSPSVSFGGSVPANNTVFCFDDAAVAISTNRTSGMSYSGLGLSDLANNTASFLPSSATSPTNTVDQATTINAIYTDSYGCRTRISRTFVVNPRITASISTPRLSFCHEDLPVNLVGNIQSFTIGGSNVNATGAFELSYTDVNNNLQNSVSNGNTFPFNADNLYNASRGVVDNSTQNFTFRYTETVNAGKICTNTVTQVLAIKAPINLDIVSLNGNPIYCSNNPAAPLTNNVLTFTGNIPNSGTFALDEDNDFTTVASSFASLVNTVSGTATINLQNTYNTVSGVGPIKQVYLQYSYTGPGCTAPAQVIESFQISEPPSIAFNTSPGNTPVNGTTFCFDGASVPIRTIQNTNVVISGNGITDTGNGTGTFNPNTAFVTTNSGAVSPLVIPINARITDVNQCVNVTSLTYTVNPTPPASFSVNGGVEFCYTDAARNIVGNETNSFFSIIRKGTTTPETLNFGSINAPQQSVSFDPQPRFDESVALGADPLNKIDFDVVYTAYDGTGCTNTLPPLVISVFSQIDVEIAGVNDGDIFCSNEPIKKLTFTPFPLDASKRQFFINGIPTPLTSNQFDLNQASANTGGNFNLRYNVIAGNGCDNIEVKVIESLPSPIAQFSVTPRCEDDLIEFAADLSTNLPTTEYTWTLIDSIRTNRVIQHRFPGSSTYSVQLKVEYPAFNGNPNLVCRDSLRLDQIVGPFPSVDFDFFNVCEDQQSEFDVTTNIPISDVRWNFGDGTIIDFGLLSSSINGSSSTTGTHENPIHQFPGSNEYLVTLIGRTAANFGNCADTVSRQVTILKKLTPSASAAYTMETLDNGRGFWRVEDRNGASTWEYAIPNGTVIKSSNPAWVTNADGPYLASDNSYMNSPCFDLTGFERPVLSLSHWSDTEASDGSTLQYSVDGGETWERLGDIGTGLDWFNRFTISSNPGNVQAGESTTGWSSETQTDWANGKHSLDGISPSQRAQLRFRVAFGSFNNLEGRDGFAFQNLRIEERNRTILVENFTNIASGTDNNNNAFRTFKPNALNSELVRIQYHTSLGGEDVFHETNPIDNGARAGFYGVTAPSQGFIDGYSEGDFDDVPNWTDTEFSLRSLVASPIEITLSSPALPENLFNVQANIKLIDNLPQGKYAVFIAIIENVPGTEEYVLRKLLPNASGTELTIRNNQEEQIINVSYNLRFVEDPTQINVVAFVQAIEWANPTQRKEILQAKILNNADLVIPTDLVTGIEDSQNSFSVYPNPADKQLIVTLPTPATQQTPMIIFDQMGKMVHQVNFEKGEQSKQVNTAELAAGVYLIKVESSQGMLMNKVVITHR
jgi:hypothetical protein